MQLKDSILLLSALSAGTAAARLHGHERRHAHPVEKRDIGDIVKVEMDGKMVSWTNEWSGAEATTAPEPTPAFQAEGGATQVVTVAAVPTASQSSSPSQSSSSSSSSSAPADGSCGNWYDNPSGEFSRDGFGTSTLDNDQDYVFYKGNVGTPWGSNIKEVSESNACNYRYVIAVHGSEKDPWTMVFWNKIGPDGGINGWYSGNSALSLTIDAGETKYVAFDGDSQGSWGAAKGTKLPTDDMGGYSCTWGEFDFGNSKNSRDLPDGHTWSGWDVSAIQAQNSNQDVQGMKICQHSDRGCSSISNLAKNVINAYTAAEEGVDGIGGNYKGNDGVRLHVTIDFDE